MRLSVTRAAGGLTAVQARRAQSRGSQVLKNCGQRLDRVGAVALKTEPKAAASDVRIPEHLAEKILASRDFTGGRTQTGDGPVCRH